MGFFCQMHCFLIFVLILTRGLDTLPAQEVIKKFVLKNRQLVRALELKKVKLLRYTYIYTWVKKEWPVIMLNSHIFSLVVSYLYMCVCQVICMNVVI